MQVNRILKSGSVKFHKRIFPYRESESLQNLRQLKILAQVQKCYFFLNEISRIESSMYVVLICYLLIMINRVLIFPVISLSVYTKPA